MRTLYDIIESAKEGNLPTHEECYYAMLAFNALLIFDNHTIIEMPEKLEGMNPQGRKLWLDMVSGESFNRLHGALKVAPDKYIGWDNDPKNPEYQKRRKTGEILLKKILGE